jgi:mono/diheme cytochrome c family protein
LGGDVAPPYAAKLPGDTSHGQAVYATFCSSCHGSGGAGGPKAGSVVDKAYLSLITDQGLRTIVITGRPDFNAPDWRNNVAGHPMSDQEITDLVAWLASQRPNRAANSTASAPNSPGGAH